MTLTLTKTGNWMLKVYTYCFLFFATAMFGFYGWLHFPMFSYIFSGLCCMMLACVFSVLVVMANGWKARWTKKSLFWLAILVLTAAEFLNTRGIVPSQGLLRTFFGGFPFISMALEAFVLSRLIRSKTDLDWFMRAVQKVSVLLCCFSILQYFLYPNMILFPLESELIRGDRIRVYLGGEMIYSLGALISIGNIFSPKRDKALSWVNLLLVLVTLAVARQARSNTAYVLAVFALAFVSSRRMPRPVRWLLYVGIGLLAAAGFIFADGISAVENLVEKDFGVMARLRGIRLFLEKFLDYPWLGMGFLYTADTKSAAHALHCDAQGYFVNTSDVGIFGLLNILGLVGVIWFFVLLNKLRKNGNRQFNRDKGIHGKVIFWYYGISMLNLIVTDLQRALMIAIAVVVTEKLGEFALPQQQKTQEKTV